MEKTHCSGCGCHADNIKFIRCYRESGHKISLTLEESKKEFPRDCMVDIVSKRLQCSKTRKILETVEELKTVM